MSAKNPAALPGAGQAGIGHVEQLPFTCPPHSNQPVEQFGRQRLVGQIHGLGARVMFEIIDQLDREHELGSDLDLMLDERFAGLDPKILYPLGGDRFPQRPIRVVGGGR